MCFTFAFLPVTQAWASEGDLSAEGAERRGWGRGLGRATYFHGSWAHFPVARPPMTFFQGLGRALVLICMVWFSHPIYKRDDCTSWPALLLSISSHPGGRVIYGDMNVFSVLTEFHAPLS